MILNFKSRKVVSLSAIRKANAKRIKNRFLSNVSSDLNHNHEIVIKARFGLIAKEFILTKEEINAAFAKAAIKNGKNI